MAPLVEISPDNMRQAAFPVTTPEGARASVQELAPRNVQLIKTWVDDRGGTIKKLTPELYGAIIDEAHKNISCESPCTRPTCVMRRSCFAQVSTCSRT